MGAFLGTSISCCPTLTLIRACETEFHTHVQQHHTINIIIMIIIMKYIYLFNISYNIIYIIIMHIYMYIYIYIHIYMHYKSNHPIHLKHSIIFSKFLRYKRICSDHRDFTKCSKELTYCFLKMGYPMTIINKQWQKVLNIQRANLLNCKEIKSSGCLPIIYTYLPSVEHVNKSIIKEFRNYSKLTSSKHPFDVTPICAYIYIYICIYICIYTYTSIYVIYIFVSYP